MSAGLPKRCLNCGAPLANGGKYCHQCGQATHTQRLTAKNFVAEAFMRLTRLNKGVVFTCCNLLVRPWHVIADYIRGRRVIYTDSVQLLLVLTFLTVVLGALGSMLGMPLPEETSHDESHIFDTATVVGFIADALTDMLLTSTVVQYLLVFLPAIPGLMLVNRRKGEARYNIAEYLLAAIYMSDAVLLFQLLVSPLDMLLPSFAVFLPYLYILAAGTCGVYKSLRHLGLTKGRRILRVAIFLLATIAFYALLLIGACMIIVAILKINRPELFAQA